MKKLIKGALCAAMLSSGITAARAQGTAPTSPVEVRIDSHALHHITPEFYGTNFCPLWNDTGIKPGTIKAFSQMGAKVVRFPGGVPAHWYNWESPLESGFTEITPAQVWRMASAGGAKMMLQTDTAITKEDVNKKSGKKFHLDASPAHQAAWVKYCQQHHVAVAFWEIGNEPEMDAPQEHKGSPEATYKWYNDVFAEQAKAIKAADPEAKVIGPASANTWFWWAQNNLERFMKAHGNLQGSGLVDGISLHWYPDGGSGAWEQHAGNAQDWVQCMDFIQNVISKYDNRRLPLYITEWSFSGGDGHNRNGEMGNALGTADCIGMFQRTGVAGQTHFVLQRITRNWGVLGMKNDPEGEDAAAPVYYALAMTSHMIGDVLEVHNHADERKVLSAYATRTPDRNEERVLLINKTKTPLSAQISTESFVLPGCDAEINTLQPAQGSVTDRSVIYNDVKAPRPSHDTLPHGNHKKVAATPFQVDVPAYSVVTVAFTRAKP